MAKKVRKEIVNRLIVHMVSKGEHTEAYKISDTKCAVAHDMNATQEEFDLAWTLAKLKG